MKKNDFFCKAAPLFLVLVIAAVALFAQPDGSKPRTFAAKNSAPTAEPIAEPVAESTAEPVVEPTHVPPPKDAEIWLPILVYHRINYAEEWRDSVYKSLTIEPEWLDAQLQYLKDNGFESVVYKDVIDYFERGIPLPERPVMINFDDGNGDNYTNAFPILEKHGYKATFFITTNYTNRGQFMTEENIRGLIAAGHEIGNHAVSHPNLPKLGNEALVREVTRSKEILEEKYGIEITVFGYPFGKYDDRVISAVQNSGHKIARSFSGKGAPKISRDNFFHTPVVSIWGNLPMSTWKSKLFKPETETE